MACAIPKRCFHASGKGFDFVDYFLSISLLILAAPLTSSAPPFRPSLFRAET